MDAIKLSSHLEYAYEEHSHIHNHRPQLQRKNMYGILEELVSGIFLLTMEHAALDLSNI